MATFTDFSDLLPDPDNKINDAGATDASGNTGPGFAKINFRSVNSDVQKSRTRSGRGVNASPASHWWEFDISYNPLTRAEFEPVNSFLEFRKGTYPFYVILPQYNSPRDSTFATYLASNTVSLDGNFSAGSQSIDIQGSTGTISGDPKPGDFFTITDGADANHTKAYKVVRVETSTTYRTADGAVAVGTRRIHIQPSLARDTADNSTLNFVNPRFRVQQKGEIVEYELDTQGLYQFSLALEEIQP